MKKRSSRITMAQAIDNLTDIIEFSGKNLAEFGFKKIPEIKKCLGYTPESPEEILHAFKILLEESFHIVYKNLENYLIESEKTSHEAELHGEEIKKIMHLIAESALQIDQYQKQLYPENETPITQSKEYQDLKKIYLEYIFAETDLNTNGEDFSILRENGSGSLPSSSKDYFLNLYSIKNDYFYELLYLTKENGDLFYTENTAQDIKLAYNFSTFSSTSQFYEQIELWHNHSLWLMAKKLKETLKEEIAEFYAVCKEKNSAILLKNIHQMLLALSLAGQEQHLPHTEIKKTCKSYFKDFLFFLRKVLIEDSYQKINQSTNPTTKEQSILNLIYKTVFELYILPITNHTIGQYSHELIEYSDEQQTKKSTEIQETTWSTLLKKFDQFKEVLDTVPHWQIKKAYKATCDQSLVEEKNSWDPYLHLHTPFNLYDIFIEHREVNILSLPSPTVQNSIDSSHINPEIETFLDHLMRTEQDSKHIMINLQNKEHWEESARCQAIEKLAKRKKYQSTFYLIHLPTDNQFYYQTEEFLNIEESKMFIETFFQGIKNNLYGFNIPKKTLLLVSLDQIENLLSHIHQRFFNKTAQLNQSQRQVFIDIFYVLYVLKLVKSSPIHSISFCDKDGLDTSLSLASMLYTFLVMAKKTTPTINQRHHIELMLFTIPILIRKRILLQPRFDRFTLFLNHIENYFLTPIKGSTPHYTRRMHSTYKINAAKNKKK